MTARAKLTSRLAQLRLVWDGRSSGVTSTRRWKSSAAPQTSFMLDEFPETRSLEDMEWRRSEPYSKVPGPTPLPLLGNNWRFLPYIGMFILLYNFGLLLRLSVWDKYSLSGYFYIIECRFKFTTRFMLVLMN